MRITQSFLVYVAVYTARLASSSKSTSASDWSEAAQRAREFVFQLTVDEKIGIVSGGYRQPSPDCVGSIGGISRLDFEGICFSDGPAGYSRSDLVSVFASGITVAASWDVDLMFKRGVALGEEFRGKGAHVHLGPSSGPIGRHAAGGRNWESFGPDPYLAGVAMNSSILGIQSAGVQACSKHYIGNEQELQRTSTVSDDGTVTEAISSNIDNRTLRELYAWPFANAIHAGTAGIMCSYNRVNGLYACENSDTISILKEELDFRGYVVSDWYATHGTASFANAGLDIEMPGNTSAVDGSHYFGDALLKMVQNGTVTTDRLTDMAERVLRPYFLLNQDEGFPSVDPSSGAVFLAYQIGHKAQPHLGGYPMLPARNVRGNHKELIRELGAAATVLLKNVNNTLPLKNNSEVGIFGNAISYPTIGSTFRDAGEYPEGYRYGTVDIGGGSGTVRHTHLVTPLQAVQRHVESYGGRLQVVMDNDDIADGRFRTIYPVPDVCLVFLKSYASEGFDRSSIELPWNSTAVVESTAAICSNTIVIIHSPGVVTLPWADNENVTAILSAHYPGEEIGNSIVEVLWGATPPSGRLPYTIPKTLEDYGPPVFNLTAPATSPDAWQTNFTEGLMIDYRHFDANDIEPQYEFGFGLTYAKFELQGEVDLQVHGTLTQTADKSKGTAPGGLKDLWTEVLTVDVQVRNSGDVDGHAVPQLYVAFPQDTTPAQTPVQVLRGFQKVFVKAGETSTVRLSLLRRDVSFWDESSGDWVIPEGDLTFKVGFSSRDKAALQTKATLI
ncbi:unnamed protein product [Clonostachys rosea]|uniref:Probable beta-glucosidase G n=1 Tax=Bionectria ochroleuca TaxID=29856 RepID=A0ABY6U7Y0_BIOOC|nr:unnamed protein product [Clonostachys rosea]